MSTTSVRRNKQATKAKHDLQEMGATVRDTAAEEIRRVGENASELFEQGRDKVRGVASACEVFLHERPLTSLVMAAGIGWLLGRLWKRR